MKPHKEETSRRRVCQAMAVLGAAGIAGCSEPDEESREEDNNPQQDREDYSDDGDSDEEPPLPPNIRKLIDRHEEFVDDHSFTLEIELLDPRVSGIDTKIVEYQETIDSGRTKLTESSDRKDEISDVEQYFTQNEQQVLVNLKNAQFTPDVLDISDGPLRISGASVFYTYLPKANIGEGKERDSNTSVIEYPIESHPQFGSANGTLITQNDRYISDFVMEWETTNGTGGYINLDVIKIDETSVEPLV